MYRFLKKGVFMLSVACLATLSLTSCDDDDPSYDNVTPPEIKVAPNTLSGFVYGKDGSKIPNATVKMGDAVTSTDANGAYIFNDVKPGNYNLVAEANGYVPFYGTIEMENISNQTQEEFWNPVLVKDVKEKIQVSDKESRIVELTYEASEANPQAKIKMRATIPANALNSAKQKSEITFRPLYCNQQPNQTYSMSRMMLIGVDIMANSETELNKPILLQYLVEEQFAKSVKFCQLVDGQWVELESEYNAGTLNANANSIGTYGLIFNLDFNVEKGKIPVEFVQSIWDNRYGKKPMKVGKATYFYKSGVDVTTTSNSQLTALVVDLLESMFGGPAETLQKKYAINMTLPVGTLLEVSGKQKYEKIILYMNKKEIDIIKYGKVKIEMEIRTREHFGGSN